MKNLFQPCEMNYLSNLDFFKYRIPSLHQALAETENNIEITAVNRRDDLRNPNDFSVSTNNEIICASWDSFIESACSGSQASTHKARFQRPTADHINRLSNPELLLDEIIGSELPVSLDSFESLSQSSLQLSIEEQCKDFVVLGSLSIAPLLKQINEGSVTAMSITLCETSLKDLQVLMHIVNLSDLVVFLRSKKIGFSLLYNLDPEILKHELLAFISQNKTLSLHGLLVLETGLSDPRLLTLSTWMSDSDGYKEFVKGFLGNDTDEINQFAHGMWNSINTTGQKLIGPISGTEESIAVICASGPSLDDALDWLCDYGQTCAVFAAGSALGSLLHKHIRPDFAVILEMSHTIYNDLCDFVAKGFSLRGITLVAPPTIDPRIFPMFDDVILFHRPLSSVGAFFSEEIYNSSLIQSGPQAANAAFESAMKMGYKEVILLGCDFSAPDSNRLRSSMAIGQSSRVFDIAVPGRGGSTVYSSYDLSVTAQMFEAALSYYKPNCYSLPVGIEISGVTCVTSLHEHFISVNNESSGQTKAKIVADLKVREQTPLITRLCNLSQYSNRYEAELIEAIAMAPCWSDTLNCSLSRFLNLGLSSEDPHLVCIKRLSRFGVFFILQSLHDCEDGNSVGWSERKQSAIRDIKNYFSMIRLFISKSLQALDSGEPWSHGIFKFVNA